MVCWPPAKGSGIERQLPSLAIGVNPTSVRAPSTVTAKPLTLASVD